MYVGRKVKYLLLLSDFN